MNKKNLKLSIVLGLLLANGVFATEPTTEKEFDINSIVYIEDEVQIDLGFDTADYLPEGFDPYKVYFDINSVEYIEIEPELEVNSKRQLPKDFDAYAYPKNVSGFNYIDENDTITLDFDSKQHLPEGFDAYIK